MTATISPYDAFLDPPQEQDGPDVWAHWAVDFLERLSRMWAAWRTTWTTRDVPHNRPGDPDAYFVLDRVTRTVGTTRETTVGSPPPVLSDAARLLDVCSAAVLKFSDESVWSFESPKQANEVAEELLKIGQDIEGTRFQAISSARLEKVCRQVRMAMRRRRPEESTGNRSISHTETLNPAPLPKQAGGRPGVSLSEARKREQLISDWHTAKTAQVRQDDFCRDTGVTLTYLTKCINWAAQRRRRINNP